MCETFVKHFFQDFYNFLTNLCCFSEISVLAILLNPDWYCIFSYKHRNKDSHKNINLYKLLYFSLLLHFYEFRCETISIQLQKIYVSKLSCLIKNQNFAAKVQKNLHMSKFYTTFAPRNCKISINNHKYQPQIL